MRMFFVNIAVKDLKKSMTFFSKLGFEFNPKFTGDTAACMVMSDKACVMLLTEDFFKTFATLPPVDPRKTCEALFTFSCSSRAEVDELVKKALDAGGSHATEPQDHGFMYDWGFLDPDGHHWGVMWMDPKAA